MQQKFVLAGIQDLLFFPFKDRESRNRLWIAIALTFAGFIVPLVPNLFVMGYAGIIMRRMIVDHEEPGMPEWTDWNELLSLGFRLLSIISIFILPAFIPMVLGYMAMILPVFMPGFLIQAESAGEAGSFFVVLLASTFAGIALFGIGLLMIIPVMVVMPPALGYSIEKDSFAASFQFREWWKILVANKAGFFIALLITWGLSILVSIAMQILYMTVVLCMLLPFVIAIVGGYLNIVVYVLYAQAYREAVMKLEEGTPVEVAANSGARG